MNKSLRCGQEGSASTPERKPVPLSLLPFFLLIVPLAEIATFVAVGSKIGVLATIALVLATAITGATLLRIQGLGTLGRIQAQMDRGQMPSRDLVHGVMIMVAGLLLLTPGFITDTLGFLLFVPAIRDRAWSFLRDRVLVTVQARGYRGSAQREERRTIDLDDDDYTRTDPPGRS
jgi:UPF0716 protein FxsA